MKHRRTTYSIKPRFEEKVRRDGEHLLWTGAITDQFYGTMMVERKVVKATHVAWFLATGKWPEKNMLHKVECSNTLCVEYNHLYEGTQKENARDTVLAGHNTKANKTHCKRGHEFTPENTQLYINISGNVGRQCKLCHKIHSLNYYKKIKRA